MAVADAIADAEIDAADVAADGASALIASSGVASTPLHNGITASRRIGVIPPLIRLEFYGRAISF